MMDRRAWLAHALAGLGAVPLSASSQASAAAAALAAGGPGAAPNSLPGMHRGLNLTHWFEYERGQGVSAAELRALRDLGFDHVRLPLDPIACGWQPGMRSGLPFMADLRAAVDDVLGAGLELVLDLHLEPGDKERIEASPEGRASIVELWRQLSQALSQLPAAQLAFELFNEPQFYGLASRHWAPFQRQMLQVVRQHAPAHLVLLSGHQGASIEGLQKLEPVRDPAVVYVFHYYAPYLFTHQGAHWMDTRWSTAGLHQGVRYPSSDQAGRTPQLTQPHPRAAREMAEYLAQGWGAERIRAEVRTAADWARKHGVRLVCNEYGVLRAHADAVSRYRWIADVRQALESERIGWSLWDYTDIFGITDVSALPGQRGKRRIEAAALKALGLAPGGVARR